VAQFEKGRLCAHGRSLAPLVKARGFGMTPEGATLKIFKLSHYLWRPLRDAVAKPW
jgi:hypothetical protein